jgi:hypothetical protein
MARLPLLLVTLLTLALSAISPLVSLHGAETNLAFAYVPYRFEAAELWRVEGSGEIGASRLEGRTLHYDFIKGAEAIILRPPDRVFLGRPTKFRLRVRGKAAGHPVVMQLRTHFMTFSKPVGELNAEGEQTIEIEAPPGHDWKWFGGENDGKLHGPLRLGEIRLEAGGAKDAGPWNCSVLRLRGFVHKIASA